MASYDLVVIGTGPGGYVCAIRAAQPYPPGPDRKSTRLNSSHTVISYAVFCLKKKKKKSTGSSKRGLRHADLMFISASDLAPSVSQGHSYDYDPHLHLCYPYSVIPICVRCLST